MPLHFRMSRLRHLLRIRRALLLLLRNSRLLGILLLGVLLLLLILLLSRVLVWLVLDGLLASDAGVVGGGGFHG